MSKSKEEKKLLEEYEELREEAFRLHFYLEGKRRDPVNREREVLPLEECRRRVERRY